jgi:hypothetical protein
MVRKPASASPPVFHAPIRPDWNDDRLRALSQEQLLALLANPDRQRHARSRGRLLARDE